MLVQPLRASPRMARISGFLTHEECDFLIALAKKSDRLHRSYTAGASDEAGASGALRRGGGAPCGDARQSQPRVGPFLRCDSALCVVGVIGACERLWRSCR